MCIRDSTIPILFNDAMELWWDLVKEYGPDNIPDAAEYAKEFYGQNTMWWFSTPIHGTVIMPKIKIKERIMTSWEN